jgi:hypothetical protein
VIALLLLGETSLLGPISGLADERLLKDFRMRKLIIAGVAIAALTVAACGKKAENTEVVATNDVAVTAPAVDTAATVDTNMPAATNMATNTP